jgi:hypothetical protein
MILERGKKHLQDNIYYGYSRRSTFQSSVHADTTLLHFKPYTFSAVQKIAKPPAARPCGEGRDLYFVLSSVFNDEVYPLVTYVIEGKLFYLNSHVSTQRIKHWTAHTSRWLYDAPLHYMTLHYSI